MADDQRVSNDERIETDSLGEIAVPADALWRAQTQRAMENFPISGEPMPAEIIRALGLIKQCAAVVNGTRKVLSPAVSEAVANAAGLIAAGEKSDQFRVDVFQTGSGTSTNMNVNEVVAGLAELTLGQPIHPNDVVNASQSSNDVFPTALHVAAVQSVTAALIPALESLSSTLRVQAREYDSVPKAGRTHLVDAAPVTLGAEFGSYATAIDNGVDRLRSTYPRMCQLAIGGTAVGTGLNAPAGFGADVAAELSRRTGIDFVEAVDHFEAQGTRDAMVELSGQLRVVAISLTKICDDLRWMSSGPATGLAEITLPTLQPGSSIMPGKVNPVVPEAVLQVCASVIGDDATIAWAGARGNFELNVMMPVMGRALIGSIRRLANAVELLNHKCVAGITVHRERLLEYAVNSPAVVTPLAIRLGYDEAAAIVKQASSQQRSIRDVVLERGHVQTGRLSLDELDALLDIDAMARGNAQPN